MQNKIDSYSHGIYEGDNDLLQVYADDSVSCKNLLLINKSWESNIN